MSREDLTNLSIRLENDTWGELLSDDSYFVDTLCSLKPNEFRQFIQTEGVDGHNFMDYFCGGGCSCEISGKLSDKIAACFLTPQIKELLKTQKKGYSDSGFISLVEALPEKERLSFVLNNNQDFFVDMVTCSARSKKERQKFFDVFSELTENTKYLQQPLNDNSGKTVEDLLISEMPVEFFAKCSERVWGLSEDALKKKFLTPETQFTPLHRFAEDDPIHLSALFREMTADDKQENFEILKELSENRSRPYSLLHLMAEEGTLKWVLPCIAKEEHLVDLLRIKNQRGETVLETLAETHPEKVTDVLKHVPNKGQQMVLIKQILPKIKGVGVAKQLQEAVAKTVPFTVKNQGR